MEWSFGAINGDEVLAMTADGEMYRFSFSLRQWHGPWRMDWGHQDHQVSWQAACRSSSGDWLLLGIGDATAQVWKLHLDEFQGLEHAIKH